MAVDGSRRAVYAAIAGWVDAALRSDDSLFTPGRPIWSAVTADDLHRRVVEQPDLSKDTFVVKLSRQLTGAPPETIQFAAELFYMHLLVADDIGGAHKRRLVNDILAWLGEDHVEMPSEFASALDHGLASSGVSFNTHRFHQVSFLLDFVRAWKALSPAAQEELLSDPWAFKTFLFERPMHAAQAQREALLHFVHPRTFEPIVAREMKAEIAAGFADLVSEPATDVDRRLRQIRAALEPEYGTDFHFWHPDLLPIWKPPTPTQPVATASSAAAPTADALTTLAESLFLDPSYLQRAHQLLRDKGQIIFFGPPGTGKTYVARELAQCLAGTGSVELVQFHPSYAYEDFVEGYRPAAIGGSAFELVPGPLKRIAMRAAEDPDVAHVLVIDEINRGNVPKLFGELYFLLEYRNAQVSLQYSREPFSLPANVLIIGTMNTVDRSIALVDLALRRRFYFMPFFPDMPPVMGLLSRWLAANAPEFAWIADVVDQANAKLGDRHAAIGPSHFMRPGLSDEWISLIWEHAVMPTLAEHFFGDESTLEAYTLENLRSTPENPQPAILGSSEEADASAGAE